MVKAGVTQLQDNGCQSRLVSPKQGELRKVLASLFKEGQSSASSLSWLSGFLSSETTHFIFTSPSCLWQPQEMDTQSIIKDELSQ